MNVTRGDAAGRHVPVLRDRITTLLSPALQSFGAVFVDGTLGMGGHTEAILQACPTAVAYGVDRDTEALALAGERLAPYVSRFRPVHAVYDEAFDVLAKLGVKYADAVLFDLGISSLQLDEADRGFSYKVDAPLDMRMDQTCGQTAVDVLNTYSAVALERVLRVYGEERFARRIAKAIVRERESAAFTDSGRLVKLLRTVIPTASHRIGDHPGKRTFQALRIEVNAELDVWRDALPRAINAVTVGGHIAVLSYHSLEDRITKQTFAAGATSTAPAGLPVELPEHAPYLKLLTRGAEQPSNDEVSSNPRAASARLRVAEKVRTLRGSRR